MVLRQLILRFIFCVLIAMNCVTLLPCFLVSNWDWIIGDTIVLGAGEREQGNCSVNSLAARSQFEQ